MPQAEYLQYGGQAIIEGVMMRSPRHFAVAVLAPNGEIVVQAEPLEKTWIGRQKWLKLPFLRGSLALLDAMALGYKALRFATNIQLDPRYQPVEENPGEEAVSEEPAEQHKVVHAQGEAIRNITVGVAMVVGLAIGLFLFNYLPNFLAIQLDRFGVKDRIAVNFATEVIKVTFFLSYIWLIGQLEEIKRVFRFHGAEHKAINALEAGLVLDIENCRKQTRLHPRCGTSFAIVVLIVSMVVFTFMPKPEIEQSKILTSICRFLVEIPVLPFIAGISYEMIRFAGKMRSSRLVRALFLPGLMTQYLTTKEPDEQQISVALAALKAVVVAEESVQAEPVAVGAVPLIDPA